MSPELGYAERREYEACLRRIVLESADAIPNEVAAYLNECAGNGLDQQEQALLTHYTRLVTHLPRAYADAVIKILVATNDETYDAWHHSFGYLDDLGIQRDSDFFPPAPVQGPFLDLLRGNEEQGLRLIQELTNTAIRNWCRRERTLLPHSPVRTPIPLMIKIGDETRAFWGDEEVYRWFRPLSLGPKPIVSALMVLEVWMEEQIEAGRAPDALFAAVLRDAECLAIVAVCLGVAMAFPVRCLNAALPLASTSPRIWTYEVNRLVRDLHEGAPSSFFPQWRGIDEIVQEREQRPQRKVDIRQFAMAYMHGPDEDLRDRFAAAVSRFSVEDAYGFEEQKTDATFNQSAGDLLSRYRAIADLSNYRKTTSPDGAVHIQFSLPQHITAGDEKFLTSYAENDRALAALLWADKSLKQGTEATGFSMPEAIDLLNSLSSASHEDDDTMFGQHLRAAWGAVLAFGFAEKMEWMKAEGLFNEGAEALISIAAKPVRAFDPYLDTSIRSFCEQLYAIDGLFAVLKDDSLNKDARERIRELILARAADSSVPVVEAVCKNAGRHWGNDPILCGAVVRQVLALSLLPRRVTPLEVRINEFHDWKRSVREEGLSNLREGARLVFPRMNDVKESYFAGKLGQPALDALPLDILAATPESRIELVQLADDLIERRIVEINGGQLQERHQNQSILAWIAKLVPSVPSEVRNRWLGTISARWPEVPQLTSELLDGYITSRLFHEDPPEPDTINEWSTICNSIADASLKELPPDSSEAIGLAVFCHFRMCLFDPKWPHIHLFQPTIERWIEAFGADVSAFPDLVVMLATLGNSFSVETQIDWFYDCYRHTKDVKGFVASHGVRTARLLRALWERSRGLDGLDASLVAKFAYLVDTLVANGIAIAAPLQRDLNS